ncbi:MAG: bifunctional DNA-formamidopyrimidine glycosylase/DNA-(apurinic or apyrimidinic site) lyase [Rhodothalassiaceae bacterium]
MPELPEVETVRAGLEAAIVGVRISAVRPRREGLRIPFPPDLGQRLTGARILSVGRRGKYLLIGSDRDDVLILHLGMSGRVRLSAPPFDPPGRHDHLLIDFDDGQRLTLNDARRFGLVDLTCRTALAHHRLLAGLGPEPLGADFDGEHLHERLAVRRTPLKSALMDQRLIAGLGNIYVSEVLHRAGLSPFTPACDIGRWQADGLVKAIRQVLAEAIAAGGSSLRDHRTVAGELGYFQHSFRVYGRAGADCPTPGCGGRIEGLAQAGRSSFYCPLCQG